MILDKFIKKKETNERDGIETCTMITVIGLMKNIDRFTVITSSLHYSMSYLSLSMFLKYIFYINSFSQNI